MLDPVPMMPDPPCPSLDVYAQPVGFFVGLDLGQARDFSAVIVSEKRVIDRDVLHAIRYAYRFRLGTNYLDVAREVAILMEALPSRPDPPQLWADGTGVGRPVIDVLRDQGLSPWGVTLTAGANWSLQPGKSIALPKSILASTLNVAFQNGTIAIAGDIGFRDQLVRELGAFRVTTTTTGVDSFNARTEADHDDLVIALGLAVFGASRNFQPARTVII